MAAGARKNAPRSPSRKPPVRARPAKAGAKPARPVARVSEGALGKFAVLANDPDFQRQVARHIETGVLAESLVKAVASLFAKGKWASEPAVSNEAIKAAQEFLAQVAKHNGPPPAEAELEEMVRSWG